MPNSIPKPFAAAFERPPLLRLRRAVGGRASLTAVVLLAAGMLGASGGSAAAAETPQQVTFVRDGRIVTSDALGRPATPLVPRGGGRYADDGEPSWDRSGQTLYFTRSRRIGRERDAAQIHFLAPDGIVRRLTPRTSAYEFSPVVSPDGTQLAFARFRTRKNDFLGDIVVRSLFTGAERVVLRRRFVLGGLGDPQWTPDARGLLYTRTELDRSYHFRPSLRLVGLDGSGDRLVRRDAGAGRYSPDGRRLAFASVADRNGETCGSDECEYNPELYVMNADGSAVRRLTNNSGADGAPSWSADGRRLAFSSTRNYPDAERPEIYTIGADGSCLTWLTNGTQLSGEPAWRPQPGSSNPLACGGAGRRALYTTNERGLKRVRRLRPLWLGRSIEGMMLIDVDLDREGLFLSYGDCSAFDPQDCGVGVGVSMHSVCQPRQLELLGSSGRLRNFRGVLLEDFGTEGGYTLYAGGVIVGLDVESAYDDPASLAHLRPALRALRPYPDPRPTSRLPAVRFPRGMLQRVRRASQLSRRLGSARAVARVTGSHVSVVRRRLVIARALSRVSRGPAMRCR